MITRPSAQQSSPQDRSQSIGSGGCREVPSATTSAVLAPTLAAMAVLLVVSITDWCEHGSLLASAVLTAYCVWLSLEAIAAAPEMVARFSPSPAWLRALELSACAGTLVVLACVGPFRKSRAAAMGGCPHYVSGPAVRERYRCPSAPLCV